MLQTSRFTDLLFDSQSWPVEILRDEDNNNSGKTRWRHKGKHRGRNGGILNRLRSQAHRPPLPSILPANTGHNGYSSRALLCLPHTQNSTVKQEVKESVS